MDVLVGRGLLDPPHVDLFVADGGFYISQWCTRLETRGRGSAGVEDEVVL